MSPTVPLVSPSTANTRVGEEAVRVKGWWRAHQWLLLRRLSQMMILGLFLLGPVAGVWLIKGTLSSSVTLGVLPLTDPLTFLQMWVAHRGTELSALMGVSWVVLFYALVGGRLYCSWVCPVNVVTDAASWLRRRLNIRTGRTPTSLRYALIPCILGASAITGVAVWEWVNPVSLTHRALIFSHFTALGAAAAVFFYDLLVAPRGWCGHLCPVGATYALIGQRSLLRVSAQASSRCNDCADCYAVCPEPQIIPIALKGKGEASPLIQDLNCTQCGRCIDVCAPKVFVFTHRFDSRRT
jgi:ferredoxin-type protein NapH